MLTTLALRLVVVFAALGLGRQDQDWRAVHIFTRDDAEKLVILLPRRGGD
jgi:hypothetical protein